jgi:pSer/pThr/pTyr-binding forkhead associated (FHA) protein
MTINMVDFPTWFSSGCYGGLACCMCAIAANALYTTLRRRGTTRQLAGVLMLCVVSALLLLPAIIWFNLRFSAKQADLSFAEVQVALAYVALWGWLLPLGATGTYCLFTLPRNSQTNVRIPRLDRSEQPQAAPPPPQRQSGVPVSFVYGEDIPWGWLEYGSGNFQGQRLALKRSIMTLGRDEENDIWLDDEMASRHHAELSWDQSRVYLTDCESLNGVSLNGKRIRGYTLLKSGDTIEIGSHHFCFILAEVGATAIEQSDPLAYHKWRSASEVTGGSDSLPATKPVTENPPAAEAVSAPEGVSESAVWKETAEVDQPVPLPLSSKLSGALLICDGEMSGQSFLLDRPVVTVGRGIESDIVVNDASISRRHVQFSRQADGDYIQDLASRNGTKVNDEPLMSPRLLQPGDVILMGNIKLEYTSIQSAQTTPLTLVITPPPPATAPISGVGLAPLRLPSKQK